ncbi:MAG: non-canonical purine NTP pyrophosphatase [Gemmatimonadetes bacterium]|nr:non-canonical purine NTP pyrophosphatase [Gemmatimonadota bacterium]
MTPRPLVIATRNAGKLKEITAVLGDDVDILSLEAYPDAPEVEEDGDTFEANALKKARTISAHTGQITLADDSGLEVYALDGAPGIHSARFAGIDASDDENNRKLLDLLHDIVEHDRSARFRCVLALVTPQGGEQTVTAAWEGRILTEPRGQHGFGYDPLFYSPAHGVTSAELPTEEKNKVSHRGKALDAAKDIVLQALTA